MNRFREFASVWSIFTGYARHQPVGEKSDQKQGFFEATCLFGNQIDSLLRIGIILKQQIIGKNDVIGREWGNQGPNDKKKGFGSD